MRTVSWSVVSQDSSIEGLQRMKEITLGADCGETPGKHFLPTVNSGTHADNQTNFL